MAKISNTVAYPSITNLDAADYLVITDAENNLVTKTATIAQIQALFGVDTNVTKTTINTGSLLTLADTAITLVPAPGAGKVLDVISIMFYLDAGSQAYDYGTGSLPIKIGSEEIASIPNSSATINSATDAVFKPEVPNTNEVIPQNTALTLGAQANPSTGSGTLYANVFYRVLTVGSAF
tara:strand:- start:1602 stop:2138 length:537 start_codon:yes stop_codon:yes gene_type:complete